MGEPSSPDGRAHRLLILDDDKQVGDTIAAIARTVGLEAQAVTTADSFFARLDEWTPDLLIVDLVMPDVDGVEVIRMLARRNARARLIISSGVGARVLDAARRAAAEHGLQIVGVLPKPFRPTELRIQLQDALERPERAALTTSTAPPASPITAAELDEAVRARQFHPVYQPKVDCLSGKLVGFEALVRWHHPGRGLVMPDRFIPLAETCGAIEGLTEQMLEHSLSLVSRHFSTAPIGIAVNVSAACFGQTDFPQKLQHWCRVFGIEHHRLTLELTETAAMKDPAAALAQLTQLRMLGFCLSLDDFGTGFSSMVQLVRLPFSEMKIDRSFVITAAHSAESRAVVTFITGLARSLSLNVTAEGVEDLAIRTFLIQVGCHHAQGYGISRPLPPDAIDAWVSDWEARLGRWQN